MKVLVIGRAGGVWEEVAALRQMGTWDATIVIGRTGIDYDGPIDHWATFHANLFATWIERRRRNGYPDASHFWCATFKGAAIRSDVTYPRLRRVRINGGSSGMIGVTVALEQLNATHVALAGIPLDPDRAHYDEAGPWEDGLNYRDAWTEKVGQMQGRVRSMSGWTRELLGGAPPTVEWLNQVGG